MRADVRSHSCQLVGAETVQPLLSHHFQLPTAFSSTASAPFSVVNIQSLSGFTIAVSTSDPDGLVKLIDTAPDHVIGCECGNMVDLTQRSDQQQKQELKAQQSL